MEKIYLCEQPHYVIQGEGNLIGKKMLLFRVSGCDVFCRDCDSKQSWKKENEISYNIEDVEYIIKCKYKEKQFDYIMVTGGAPSLYMDFIYILIKRNKKWKFQIEDAGDKDWSKFKNFKNVYFSFSPKIGALEGNTIIQDWNAFKITPKNYICKIVVNKNDWINNYTFIKHLQKKYNIPNNKIYLMPLGIHREDIIEQSQFIINKCFELGYDFSPRLHVLLFDNKKLI